MNFSFDMILLPFAWLLRWLYFLLGNYGVAIIVFCLLTKVLLFPLSLMGKKSMVRMSGLTAQQQEIQRKYGKDKNRANMEVQKLYEREKVNPMGGCLWSLLPLPILIGLYSVMRRPLFYMMGFTADQLNNLADYLTGSLSVLGGNTGEIKLAELLFQRFDEVKIAMPELAGQLFRLDFSFFGLNLSETPSWNFWASGISWASIGLFLIPLVSALLSYLSMQISLKTNEAANPTAAGTPNPANNVMMKITMPLMSLWIGFTMPAGLGIYWISNSLFTMIQEQIAGRLLKGDYEKVAQERAERERREREEEKEQKRQAAEAKAQALEEARRTKKKVAVERKAGAGSQESRVGIRAYARGRAYDPKRFGEDGPTLYKDPKELIDEAAVEAALAKQAKQRKKKTEEAGDAVPPAEFAEQDAALESGEETALVVEEDGRPQVEAGPAEEAAEPAEAVPGQGEPDYEPDYDEEEQADK